MEGEAKIDTKERDVQRLQVNSQHPNVWTCLSKLRVPKHGREGTVCSQHIKTGTRRGVEVDEQIRPTSNQRLHIKHAATKYFKPRGAIDHEAKHKMQ